MQSPNVPYWHMDYFQLRASEDQQTQEQAQGLFVCLFFKES